jgi:hypothetical protein
MEELAVLPTTGAFDVSECGVSQLALGLRDGARVSEFKVWSLGFRVWGLRLKVWGLGFRV